MSLWECHEAICQHVVKPDVSAFWSLCEKWYRSTEDRGFLYEFHCALTSCFTTCWHLPREPAYLPDICPEVQYFLYYFASEDIDSTRSSALYGLPLCLVCVIFETSSLEVLYSCIMDLEKCRPIIFLKIFVCVHLKKISYTSGMAWWWFKWWVNFPFLGGVFY